MPVIRLRLSMRHHKVPVSYGVRGQKPVTLGIITGTQTLEISDEDAKHLLKNGTPFELDRVDPKPAPNFKPIKMVVVPAAQVPVEPDEPAAKMPEPPKAEAPKKPEPVKKTARKGK